MKTRSHINIIMITVMVIFLFSIPAYGEKTYGEQGSHSEKEIIEWVKLYVPQGFSQLKDLKKENPEEYENELLQLSDQIDYLNEVKQRSPEMFNRLVEAENLEFESWLIAEKASRSKDQGKKNELKAKLKELLEKIYQIRLQEVAMEIKDLEKELSEVRAMFEKKKAMKTAIIDHRLRELILSSRDETLEWW